MTRKKFSYKTVRQPSHPRAHGSSLPEHMLIAERALGKPLPPKAQIHHADENPRNNTPSNLVICQDRTYHKLLHFRARIVRAGGNPDTEKICSTCKTLKPLADFNRAVRSIAGISARMSFTLNGSSV